MANKKCSCCSEIKKNSKFNKNNTKKDGLQSYCRECSKCYNKANYDPHKKKESDLLRRYNITYNDFLEMYLIQKNKCAICKKKLNKSGKNVANVDHNHNTGKLRGLLCRECNLGLGYFKDNIDILKSAAKYLIKRGK